MIPIRRPTREDTEDELMQMQQEFLSGRTQPSTHVVNKRKAETEKDVMMDVSENCDESKKLKSEVPTEERLPSESSEKQETLDTHDIPVTAAFTQILERDTRHAVAVAPSLIDVPFPQVKPRNKKFSSGNGKKSIFSQEMEWKRKNNENTASKSKFLSSSGFKIIDGTGLGSGATAQSEAQKIHEENMAKIAAMSKEEIMQSQNELLSQLDPKVVNFLKSKRKQETTSPQTQTVMNIFSKPSVNVTELSDDIDMSELPINPKEAKKKYLHMDKVEKDKLAWMTMLPNPKPVDFKTGCTARFDFDGKLISQDSDVSTHQGLHHHGEEPEVPGYTVEELFLLSRSTVQSQRIMALQVLARILRNNWQGLFDDCLQAPLLPLLHDAGIVPLLRWALDDTTESVISAATFAIHSLLVCEPDEACLDKVFSWHYGYLTPFLKLPGSPEGDKLDNETSLKELSDAEIIKLDVIKGFLRMDLLPRLRYILEVCKPVSSVVEHILQILIRIGRHSLEAATKLVNCPRLIATIVSEFLPTNWGVVDTIQNKVASVYGSPLSYAVKLIRVIASGGRHLASCLVSNFNIMKSLNCYLTIDPSDDKLPAPEALKLNMESMRTWRVLLAYGLAAQNYLDLFPVIVPQLKFCQTLSLSTELSKHAFDYQYAAALIGIMEAVIGVASSNSDLAAERSNMESVDQPLSPILWNHVTGLFDIMETCFKKWLWELVADGTSDLGLNLLGTTMDFFSMYFKKFFTQPHLNIIDLLGKIETLYEKCIITLIQSSSFTKVLNELCSHSLLLSSEELGTKRNAETLGCLGSIMWASDVVPVLKENSPFHFVSSLTNFIIALSQLHHSLKKEILKKEFLSHPAIVEYVKLLLSKQPSSNVNWFCRFEIHFLHHLIMLSADCGCDTLVHNLSLHLVPLFCEGHEYLLQELLSNVIFHLEFYPERNDLSWAIQQLQVGDKVMLHSATGQVIEANEWKILHESCQQFADIRTTFTTGIVSSVKIKKNRWCMEQISHLVESLSVSGYSQTVLPLDWIFLHIMQLYNNSKQEEMAEETSETVAIVTRSLQWIHLLQVWRSSAIYHIPPHVIFCHLSTVFLIGNTLFLNKHVQGYLQSLLSQLIISHPCHTWNLSSAQLPGITSFDDLYGEILTHFEGVSYGDHLFANYVLVPLQQSYGSKWKKMLFSEHSSALNIFRIPLSEIMVPVENYLSPVEDDEELLMLYCQNVLTGHIQEKRSPLLYLMAVHHLNHFLFTKTTTETKLKSNLLKHIMKAKTMEAANHIIHYKSPEKNSQIGFCVHRYLPNDYKEVISQLLPGYVDI